MKKVGITNEKAAEFVNELREMIDRTGFNTLSKTDLYDYLLYLFDKHGDRRFLDEDSNYQNGIDLKIKEARLKSAKLNIAMKYRTADERKASFERFLIKIVNNDIRIQDAGEDFVFFIDDPSARLEFESHLKKELGTTLEYGENRERVKLKKADMFGFLKKYTGRGDADFGRILEASLSSLGSSLRRRETREDVIDWLKDVAKDITKGVLSSAVRALISGA